jgi:hypothetical protein
VDLRGAKIDAKGYDGSPQAAIARGSVLFRKVQNFGHGLELRISIDEINVMAVSFPCCMEPVRGGKAVVRKTRSSPSSLKVTTVSRTGAGNGQGMAWRLQPLPSRIHLSPMRTTNLILAALVVTGVQAQTDIREFHAWKPDTLGTGTVRSDSIRSGTVTIHENEKVTRLMADYAAHERSLKGFRIQVFLGDRNTAEQTRRSFLLKHPDTPAYLSYLAPNFRVRVGDLRDRVAAEKLLEGLKDEFPGSYVVPDDIELPHLMAQ